MSIRLRPGGGGGSGDGVFGAAIEQRAADLPAKYATAERTDERERPAAASDFWNQSIGGVQLAGPRITLTTPEGAGIIIQFDADAAVEGYQISVVSGTGRSYNGGLKTVRLNTTNTVSQNITWINTLSGFPGTASLAPGALGGRQLEVQSHTVGGLVPTYFSEYYAVNYTSAVHSETNFSLDVVEATADNLAGTVEWDAVDRVCTVWVAASGTRTTNGFGGTAMSQAVSDSGAPIALVTLGHSTHDAPVTGLFYITPGQRVDYTGGRDALSVPARADRGLLLHYDGGNPTWELNLVERVREEIGRRSWLVVGGAPSSRLSTYFGPAPAPARGFFRNGGRANHQV
ncbi:MAG: hypothetical protein OXC91_14480, partial [Rhodobacteraceae bacterium]|nr:hypothetical protein [Paracoccaceae bacterium]